MEFITKILTATAAAMVGMFIGIIIVAWPFMLLWNWLMPAIFGLVKITFWQSIGLLFLCMFLFKDVHNSNTK